MKIDWEEIFSNGEIKTSYYEATYRAKVFGGWLIRHETCCNYQYEHMPEEPTSIHEFIEDEGFQTVRNTITFMPDPNHEWGKGLMEGVL